MLSRLLFFIILFVFHIGTLCAAPKYEVQRGLSFLSYEVNQEERTSLNLTPEKPLKLKDGFSLEFDYKQRRYSYGCIFRIIVQDKLNINFFSNQETANNYNYFTLAVDNKEVASIPYNSINNFDIEKWDKIRIRIDPEKHSITISIQDYTTTVSNVSLLPTDDVRIFFGANNYLSYFTKDVTPMIIRDINIYDVKNDLKHSWDMGRHRGQEIFDTINNQKAVAQNGIWEIDKYARWKKLGEIKVKGENPQIAFDADNGRVFVVKDNLIYQQNLQKNRTDTIRIQKGNPYNSITNNLIYDPLGDRLISYHVGASDFSVYDFNTHSWSDNPTRYLLNAMHHNSSIAKDRKQLITFGGYGEHRYNAVLTKYKLEDGSFEQRDFSQHIEPRYLGSSAYIGNGSMYVLGGYGCKSGIQDGFTRNYYDLYLINTDSMNCRKIWQFEDNNLYITFSQTMVIDNSERYIYTLAYENDKRKTFVRLNRFGLDSPDRMVFADSIPYQFHDVSSFCNLFLNEKTSELVAIVSFLQDGETSVNIYSLPLPPLNEVDLIQEQKSGYSWLLWLALAIFIVVGVVVIIMFISQNKTKDETLDGLDYVLGEQTRTQCPAIYLLGGFQIIDRDGNDITGKFTGVLKNLFLCILLKTLQDEKGVTSRFIEEALWGVMDQSSAMNNRNVNMRKLRLLLQNLGNVNIINDNSYWRIEVDSSIYCDYKRILQLIKELRSGKYNHINEALDLIANGNLLPATQEAWVDVYKSEYSDQVTEVLTELGLKDEIKSDLKLLLKTANAMLVQDRIDENAISLKCYALYHLGKKGLALRIFNNFCVEYKEVLGTSPTINFQTIIKQG